MGPDATIADVAAAIGDWEIAVVVSGSGVVTGLVRPEGLAADGALAATAVTQPAPATVRPSIPIGELAASMDDAGQERVLVTTLEGKLIGLVRRADLLGG